MTILEKYRQWMKIERSNSKKTIDEMIRLTEQFIGWLNNREIDLDTINQKHINDYLMHCNKRYNENSLVPITANLRKFLMHFLNKDLNIKIASTRPSDRDKTALTKEEIQRIFEMAKDNALAEAILKTLYYSGMRRQEIVNLNIDDIDFNRLKIIIKHGKGNRADIVNITKDCAMALQRWMIVRPKPKEGHENALFISSWKTRISGEYVKRMVKKYATLAGITKHIYPHKFRITMITHMAEHPDCSINEIQIQSRHRDLRTLLGYVQHSSKRVRNTYDKIFDTKDSMEDINNDVDNMMDAEHYKKIAFQKYLNGELDIKTLNNVLSTFESKQEKQHRKDMAYQ